MANVLIACEFSGVVREAFRARGHNAISCDLLPADDKSNNHVQGRIEDLLHAWPGWADLMIAHPPCTYLTNAGVRHLHENVTSVNGKRAKVHGQERWDAMIEATKFFNLLKNADIPRIVVENPIPHGYARDRIGKYDQIIQPWMFGHPERKATCLWLKNLPHLVPTNNVKEEMLALPRQQQHKMHYLSPSPDRWKIRSVTYKGIAEAMAEQYGELVKIYARHKEDSI